MKVYVKIILLKDIHGNKASVTFEDSSDIVQVCGLHDKQGKSLYFETDAHCIANWAKANDIEIKEINYSYHFDELWKSV